MGSAHNKHHASKEARAPASITSSRMDARMLVRGPQFESKVTGPGKESEYYLKVINQEKNIVWGS